MNPIANENLRRRFRWEAIDETDLILAKALDGLDIADKEFRAQAVMDALDYTLIVEHPWDWYHAAEDALDEARFEWQEWKGANND